MASVSDNVDVKYGAYSGKARRRVGWSRCTVEKYFAKEVSATPRAPDSINDAIMFYAHRSKTLEEQWYEIVATVARRGVLVDWKAAYDKWKRLVSIHKEISDWERNTPSGKISYWQMSAQEHKDEGRFGNLNFDRDAYVLMERFYGHDPGVNPPSSIVDSSNQTHTPVVSVAAQSDIADDTFQKTPTNGGIAKKAPKRTHVHDVGLKEATRDIASALEAAEEAKNV
ncbi:hypothetical protein L7F22_055327 [Adiantum nelumboides]|nr:hypothetical protein [Adiantum nelumboides]